jgi:hypothetical protein
MVEYDPDLVLIEKLKPILRQIVREELVCSKIIVGATAIKKVLGIKTTPSLMKYYNEYGLPMVKGNRGFWEIHSDSIKDWMNIRSLMARKARELGFQVNSRRGAGRYPRLERLTEQEMAQVQAGIREDNAR